MVALVVAGGTGSRMGRPKQFLELLGEPALLHTLRAFEDATVVDSVYVVGDAGRVATLASEGGIRKYAGCAAPGEARPGSTMSGLGILDEPDDAVVLVHDGSRCLVTTELIERVVAAALDPSEPVMDGVVPALPVSDTVKEVREGVVRETLDRSNLRTVQTPQAFRLGPLREVYDSSADLLAHVTDDASLVELRGGSVRVVEGERTNIKLTSPEDLVFARAILESRLAEAER
ncbi:2-C-methyl-D-erythritol 4-phosphate cytidylyltransferase [soil metagenome]